MPATYSFSLNLSKDRDIIDLMENAKNKSALIRKALHSIHRVSVYELYIERLEKLVRTLSQECDFETPPFSRLLARCYEIKEEERLLKEPSHQESHNLIPELE
tara:strand:+ start:473 stop:781 length:309 start_codon:yes stop_codon:yes gene_type:complete